MRLSLNTLLMLVFYSIVTAGMFATYRTFETYVHPIVRDFIVEDYVVENDKIMVSGTLNKVRYCRFVGVSVYGTQPNGLPALLPLMFNDVANSNLTNGTTSRSTGVQRWGPWQITIPHADWRGTISFYAGHSCTPFWQTQTHMAVLDVYSCGDYVCIQDQNPEQRPEPDEKN